MTTIAAIDPTSGEFLDDQVGALRRAGDLAASPFGLHLMTQEACEALLRDPRFHPGVAKLCEASGITEGRFYDDFTTSVLAVGGDAHRRLRRPVNPFFQSKAIEQNRAWLRSFTEGLVEVDEVEYQSAIAAPIPAGLFCQMVGVGESEIPFITRVSDSILKIFYKDPAVADEVTSAYDELAAWCEDVLAAKRRAPGDDLASELALADGLTEHERVNLLTTIMEASTDNTSNQLSLVVDLLCDHPDEWERLRADRSRIPLVVAEGMRLRPRVTTGNRTTDEDVDFRGLAVPAGSWVFAAVLAAQRDPSVHERPDDFWPERPGGGTPLLFGLGPHYCIGAGLARLELEVALDVMADRWESFERSGPSVRLRAWTADGLLALPLTVGRA